MQINLKIFYTIISIFLFYLQTGNCQEIDKKTGPESWLSVQFGLSDFHIREELASPFIYRGAGLTCMLQYQRRSDKSDHELTLTAFYNSLSPKYYLFYATNGRFGLRYNYFRYIVNNERVRILAGGGIYSFFNISEYGEHKTEIDIRSHPYYLSHSLEIAAAVEYSFDNFSNVFLKINIPIVNNVSRTDYLYTPAENFNYFDFHVFGKTEFTWNSPLIGFRAGYLFRAFNSVSFEADYDFQYSSYNEPRVIKMYMNNFRIGANFKL